MSEEHKELLDELAQVTLKFQDAADKTGNPVYYEGVMDLQKVFSYLYVFGEKPSDDSNR